MNSGALCNILPVWPIAQPPTLFFDAKRKKLFLIQPAVDDLHQFAQLFTAHIQVSAIDGELIVVWKDLVKCDFCHNSNFFKRLL